VHNPPVDYAGLAALVKEVRADNTIDRSTIDRSLAMTARAQLAAEEEQWGAISGVLMAMRTLQMRSSAINKYDYIFGRASSVAEFRRLDPNAGEFLHVLRKVDDTWDEVDAEEFDKVIRELPVGDDGPVRLVTFRMLLTKIIMDSLVADDPRSEAARFFDWD
jgi:hypothetical protein